MIEPKELPLNGKTYLISKFPAIQGREIVAKYPLSAMPKLGDYAVNEETMLKLMAFVAVQTDNGPLMLTTKGLVNNHVPDWETLAKIEMAMLEYNCSFFGNGGASTLFEGFAKKLQASISQMLMDLSAQSSKQSKPRSRS